MPFFSATQCASSIGLIIVGFVVVEVAAAAEEEEEEEKEEEEEEEQEEEGGRLSMGSTLDTSAGSQLVRPVTRLW